MDSLPIPIGHLSRIILADAVRAWAAGKPLTEQERALVDEALATNRMEMIQAVFAERRQD